VLRGGAFFYDPVSARCASRVRDFPDGRYFSIGFRVVVSPFL
jgi:formylglycine-generating enzyme required for sulfatase activity